MRIVVLATAQSSQSLSKFDPLHRETVEPAAGAKHTHPPSEQSFDATVHVETPATAIIPLQYQARSLAKKPPRLIMFAPYRHKRESTHLLGSVNRLSSAPRAATTGVGNMPVENDASYSRVRLELERLIDELDTLGLFQAAAYASMAADCLDRARASRYPFGPNADSAAEGPPLEPVHRRLPRRRFRRAQGNLVVSVFAGSLAAALAYCSTGGTT